MSAGYWRTADNSWYAIRRDDDLWHWFIQEESVTKRTNKKSSKISRTGTAKSLAEVKALHNSYYFPSRGSQLSMFRSVK